MKGMVAVGHGKLMPSGEGGNEFDVFDRANVVNANAGKTDAHALDDLLPIGIGAGNDVAGTQVLRLLDEELGVPCEWLGFGWVFFDLTA